MDGKTEISLSIVETKDDRQIFIINEEWFEGSVLLWPPNKVLKKSQKALLNTVSTSDWTKITNFTILQQGIRTIEEANERLTFYCMYENTQDKIQTDAAIALKRKHPTDFVANMHLNYNSMFDKQFEDDYTSSTPNTEHAENLECDFCGIQLSIDQFLECRSCSKKICVECDEMYHRHPLRSNHKRIAFKPTPKHPSKSSQNERMQIDGDIVPRKTTCINDVDDLRDHTINKVDLGSAKNNGVIPKPVKKTTLRRVYKNQDDILAKPKGVQKGPISLERIFILCKVCGKDAAFKCVACDLESFCSECDKMYHFHPLRSNHKRVAFKPTPKYPGKNRQNNERMQIYADLVPRKATYITKDLDDLRQPTINKVGLGSAKNNGVIPKPIKKTALQRVDKNHDIDFFAKPRSPQKNYTSPECGMCGAGAVIKCFDCALKLFCKKCNEIYHLHPLRTQHQWVKTCPETVTSNALSTSISPTSSHGMLTSSKQTLSRMILDLPIVFEENLTDTDKEIINLDDSSGKLLTELNNFGEVLENTEMQPLKGNFKKQVKTRKTVKNGKKIGPNSVAIKRIVVTLKQVQKDMGVLLNMVKKVKTDQLGIKTNINAFKNEIGNLAEIVTKSKENVKKTIEIDESFIMPGFPCKSIVAIRQFNEDCRRITYSDQVAVRFMNLTSENIKDIGSAVKRIMEHMFPYSLLMDFSWTGQSSLNSETNRKENFSDLTGVVSVIRQAATLNLLDTEKVREASLKAVKDVVRRASQNYNRQMPNK